MPKTRQQKVDTVTKLSDKLARSKSIVFADYKGMNMSQLSDLRNQLNSQGAEFTVTKNNLLQLALKNSDLSVDDQKVFEGPIATLFSYEDEVSPIKTLTKSIKDTQIGSIKAGFLNGEYLEASKINKLAQLPSTNELRAKLVGSLGSPLYGIVGVLQANLRNLVYALDQIRIQKGGE